MGRGVDVVQVARDKLIELDRLQAAQDAERAQLKEFLAVAERLQGSHHELGAAVQELAREMPRAKPTPVSEIRKRAAAIIESVDRPVPLSELLVSLTRTGVVIGGTDQRSNLSAKLSGDASLRSIPGKGWVIRKDQGPAVPAAGPYMNGAEASG